MARAEPEPEAACCSLRTAVPREALRRLSPVLGRALQLEDGAVFAEAHGGSVTLACSPEALAALAEFVRRWWAGNVCAAAGTTVHFPVDPDVAMEVLCLARYLQIEPLARLCEAMLADHIECIPEPGASERPPAPAPTRTHTRTPRHDVSALHV